MICLVWSRARQTNGFVIAEKINKYYMIKIIPFIPSKSHKHNNTNNI